MQKDAKGERMKTVSVLGLPYFCGNTENAKDAVLSLKGSGGAVFTPNAEMAYRAAKNSSFFYTLSSADLLLPDGEGIVIGARMAKKVLFRTPGVDVGRLLLNSGVPIFLLGGKPGVAEAARLKIKAELSNAHIVGTESGFFPPESEETLLKRIRESGAEILFVCLGSPKQEFFITRHKEALSGIICLGLGGSLDVYAGRVRRAPHFFQRHGLEWFYRLLVSPKRLFRMRVLPLFLFYAWRRRKEK